MNNLLDCLRMIDKRFLFLVIGGICFIIFGCVFLGLFFGGYMVQNQWNLKSESVECVIVANEARPDTCTRSCNCVRICSGTGNSRSCHQSCSSCPYTCYNGYTVYMFFVNNVSYTDEQKFYEKVDSSDLIYTELNAKYPVNSRDICYYQPDNPRDSRLELYDDVAFFVASIIVGVIGCLILIAAGGYTIYLFIK